MAPMHELHFIVVSADDTKAVIRDAASRQLIRTRAARAARSHNTSEHSERHYKQSIAASTASQRGGMNRFRSQPLSPRTNRSFPVVNHQSPLNDHLSVWDPVVGPLGSQAWDLLHYYRHFFRPNSWALDAKRDWFAFIIEDPAATHATLSFVALNCDLEEGTTISARTLSHRYRALQLVRQELAQQQSLPKDALIGAVALLAVTEGLEGHSSSASAHVKALSKLVNLRGGFAKLQKNEALSRLVVWADLCYITTSPSEPGIPSLSDQVDAMPDQSGSDAQDDAQYTFHRTMRWVMPGKISHMLKMLASLPKYPPTEDTTPQERQNVSRLIYDVNQGLLSIYREDSFFDSGPVGKLAKALCYATHLYISLVLRQMPRRTTAVVERAARLNGALREIDSVAVWDRSLIESYLVISLWAHTLHFCSLMSNAQADLQDPAFKYLLSATSVLNLEQFCQQLDKISWIKFSFDNELSCILEYRRQVT